MDFINLTSTEALAAQHASDILFTWKYVNGLTPTMDRFHHALELACEYYSVDITDVVIADALDFARSFIPAL